MHFTFFALLFELFLLVDAAPDSPYLSINYRLCYNQLLNTKGKEGLKSYLEDHFQFIKLPSWVENIISKSDCTKRGLSFVPRQAISDQTEFLDLSQNDIRFISSSDFEGLKNLSVLDLQFNCWRMHMYNTPGQKPTCKTDLYIKKGAFKNLTNLRFLIIDRNYLRQFPSDLPSSLRYLDISLTLLGNVTTSLVKDASNLRGISAEFNCIIINHQNLTCPKNFSFSRRFSNFLQVANLAANGWEHFPSFLLHDQLQVLLLTRNPFLGLKKSNFINGTQLKVLWLNALSTGRRMRLETGVFDYLVNLEELNLSQNYITDIANDLFRYNTKLQILDLSRNFLFKTYNDPTYLAHLTLLQFLDISGNSNSNDLKYADHLKELRLGSSYANLTSLETLFIGFYTNDQPLTYYDTIFSSRFDTVSDQTIEMLASMKSLKSLSLAGLSLKWLNSTALSKLSYLQWLDVSNNQLQFQNTSSCKNSYLGQPSADETLSRSMKPADCDENVDVFRIKVHSSYLSDRVLAIPALNLSNNLIESLNMNLNFLTEAFVVDLSNNRIRHISQYDFKNFSNLRVLILDHNPLHRIGEFAFINITTLKTLSMYGILLNMMHFSNLHFLHNLPNYDITFRWKDQSWVVTDMLYILRKHNVSSFKSISNIDLSANPITNDLTYTTFLFSQAKSIVLRDCQIISSMLLSPLLPDENYLKTLDLGYNLLNMFPINITANLLYLEELFLDHNSLSYLSGHFLFRFIILQVLVLSHNQISYIQPGFFQESKLVYLDLSFNEVSHLGGDILPLTFLNNLKYLDFRGNVIDCSCGVWDVFRSWSFSLAGQRTDVPGYKLKCTTADSVLSFGGCITCQSPYNIKNLPFLWYLSYPSCSVEVLMMYTICFTTFTFLFILLGTLGYSKLLRVVFRKVNQQFRVRSLEPDFNGVNQQGDVFVLFDIENNEIGDWVDFHLCKAMKNGYPPIPLRILGKHNSCGVAPSQQVLRNIINCRKTILLLSYDFCLKKTCRFVFSALQELQCSKGGDHLVLVAWSGKHGSPRIPRDIQQTFNRKKHHFLRFDSTDDDLKMFFETLRTALLDNTNDPHAPFMKE